jgi:hypothetical protein
VHIESDGVLKASVSRLDGRIRSLESQGVRADRRAAELAGLAQALTEEQRALLIRLDRLEEQMRSGVTRVTSRELQAQPLESRTLHSDDVLQRLERLEQEQHTSSQNFRLMMSLVDETELRHRHQQASLHADESLEKLCLPATGGPGERLARFPLAETSDNAIGWKYDRTLRNTLGEAEQKTAQSLQSARDLLARCEGSTLDACQENIAPWPSSQNLDSSIVKPRPDRLESKLQSLSNVVETLRLQTVPALETKMDLLSDTVYGLSDQIKEQSKLCAGLASQKTSVEQLSELVQELPHHLRPSTVKAEQVHTKELLREHSSALAELRAKFKLLPCSQQLSDLQGSLDSQRACVEELASELRAADATCTNAVAKLQCQVLEMVATCRAAPAVHVPSTDGLVMPCDDANLEGHVKQAIEEHSIAIAEVQTRIQTLVSHQGLVVTDQVASQRVGLEELSNEVRAITATTANSIALVSSRLEILSDEVRAISTTTAGSIVNMHLSQRSSETPDQTDLQLARLDVLSNEVRVITTTTTDSMAQLFSRVEGLSTEISSISTTTTDSLVQMHSRVGILSDEMQAISTTTADSLAQLQCCIRDRPEGFSEESLKNNLREHSDAIADAMAKLFEMRTSLDAQRGQLEILTREIQARSMASIDDGVTRREQHKCANSDCAGPVVCESQDLTDHSEALSALEELPQAVDTVRNFCLHYPASEDLDTMVVLNADAVARVMTDLREIREDVVTLRSKLDVDIAVERIHDRQQFSDMLRRLEFLSQESTERVAKTEEHEVRLNLALTKQAAWEHKLQACLDRVEQVPRLSQLKDFCKTELASSLATANSEGEHLHSWHGCEQE